MADRRLKSILCHLTDAEYPILCRAADVTATSVEDYVVRCALTAAQRKRPGEVCTPHRFGDRLLSTDRFPDTWYEASTEEQLVGVLKQTLRERDLMTAAAMAIELLDFPDDWTSLARNARPASTACPEATDRDLIDHIRSAVPTAPVNDNAAAWDCYKLILAQVCSPDT